MPRPCCFRHVEQTPCAAFFKPAGVPARLLLHVVLGLDELEALRLADLEGLYQEQAAEQMKISRPTFSRLVEQARRKVADALIHGKALRMEGGRVILRDPAARDSYGRRGCGNGRRRECPAHGGGNAPAQPGRCSPRDRTDPDPLHDR